MLDKLKKLLKMGGDSKYKPVRNRERYACPFYGFSNYCKMMSGENSNRCGLLSGGDMSCEMEISEMIPYWHKCPLKPMYQKTVLAMFNYSIFPSEFHPKGIESWDGIPFSIWMDYVMSDKCPRLKGKPHNDNSN
jgi:hypothetical protein